VILVIAVIMARRRETQAIVASTYSGISNAKVDAGGVKCHCEEGLAHNNTGDRGGEYKTTKNGTEDMGIRAGRGH
jgi:hypothetical protein